MGAILPTALTDKTRDERVWPLHGVARIQCQTSLIFYETRHLFGEGIFTNHPQYALHNNVYLQWSLLALNQISILYCLQKIQVDMSHTSDTGLIPDAKEFVKFWHSDCTYIINFAMICITSNYFWHRVIPCLSLCKTNI